MTQSLFLKIETPQRRACIDALQPDEVPQSIYKFDMPFFHTPCGKQVFVALICFSIVILPQVLMNTPTSELPSRLSALMQAAFSFPCLICFAAIAAVNYFWVSTKRLVVLTDKRVLFATQWPILKKTSIEGIELMHVKKIVVGRLFGIQTAKIFYSDKAGKSKWLDISEIADVSTLKSDIEKELPSLSYEQHDRWSRLWSRFTGS